MTRDGLDGSRLTVVIIALEGEKANDAITRAVQFSAFFGKTT
jgi:hypothetical protein